MNPPTPPYMKKDQKRMTCGFSPALYAAVQSAAQDEDLSFSEYVESVMNEKMEQMKAYKPRPAAYWRRLSKEPSGGVSFRVKVDADAWRHLARRRKANYLATGKDEEPCEHIEALIRHVLQSEMTKPRRQATTAAAAAIAPPTPPPAAGAPAAPAKGDSHPGGATTPAGTHAPLAGHSTPSPTPAATKPQGAAGHTCYDPEEAARAGLPRHSHEGAAAGKPAPTRTTTTKKGGKP